MASRADLKQRFQPQHLRSLRPPLPHLHSFKSIDVQRMANQCIPHLPEAVYDVQAEVRPIHNTKLIWVMLVPGMIASS